MRRSFLLLAAAVAAAACAPPAPTPAPEPAPAEPPPRARADTAPAPVQVPQPRRPAPAPRAPVMICSGGDVTLGTNLDTTWAVRRSRSTGASVDPLPDPDWLLAPLRLLVADADIVLLNVEAAIGEGPAEEKCAPGSTACYAFRQQISSAAAIRRIAPDAQVVGNVANNHALDAGSSGLRQTVRHLREAGVHVTGFDTLGTVVITAAADTVAFLGFYTGGEAPDARSLSAVRRHVARAAAAYRRVVVTAHIGAEGIAAQRTRDTTEIFLGRIDRGNPVAFARTALQAGATLVVGHGPHVMRAMEWQGDALIVYSLGNLITYGPFNLSEPLNRGGIACAAMDEQGAIADAFLRSTVQTPPGTVAPDPAGRAAALVDSLSALDFPATGARLLPQSRIMKPAPR